MKSPYKPGLARLALASFLLLDINACSYWVNSVTENFAERLQQTILNHNDPATVAEALPGYLLMLESSAAGGDEKQRLSTANLYNAFLGLLPENDKARKQRLSRKSLDLALQGLCLHKDSWCDLQQKSFQDLESLLQTSDNDDIAGLYSVASAWAGWIQNHSADWNAIAQLAQVKLLMQRVVALDDGYKQGNAHVYLAVMESLLPASLGGNPALAQQHFQRAQQLAPQNLMVNVLYAKHYARMAFDRELHDRLLTEVLKAPTTAPNLTLINTLAQQQAQPLLDSANDYF